MKVYFRDRKLKKVCEQEKTRVRRFGPVMAGKSCVGMQSQQSKLQALKIPMDNYNQTAYLPDSPLHPGSVVSDYLESNGWSQRELSMRTGITLQVISAICNCKSPITTATALENVFQRPAHFWLGLQQQYNDAVPDCGSRQQRIEAIK